MAVQHLSLSAMALDVPDVPGHPNRMPFSGVLTRVDSASDSAPHGSPGGRRVLVTRAAAEAAIPSLLGMPVNFAVGIRAHAMQAVVGTIRAAHIDGDAIHVEGDIFAKNFPIESAAIKQRHAELGFSYEMDVRAADMDGTGPIVVTDCVFTGAAILLRDHGAYLRTSLAAAAAEGAFQMDEETRKAIADLVGEAIKASVDPLAASVAELKANPVQLAAASVMPKVEPHAARLEGAADKMESDGIGAHATAGHAKLLRDMAASMRSEAARGVMPSTYHGSFMAAAAPLVGNTEPTASEKALRDEVASLKTMVTDLKAAGVAHAVPPERKTVAPGAAPTASAIALPPHVVSLLAAKKIDLPTGADQSMSLSALDEALSGLPTAQRAGVKASLVARGIELT